MNSKYCCTEWYNKSVIVPFSTTTVFGTVISGKIPGNLLSTSKIYFSSLSWRSKLLCGISLTSNKQISMVFDVRSCFVDFASSFVFLLASVPWSNCEQQNSSVLTFLKRNCLIISIVFPQIRDTLSNKCCFYSLGQSKHGFAETPFTLKYTVKNASLKSYTDQSPPEIFIDCKRRCLLFFSLNFFRSFCFVECRDEYN